VLGEIYFTTKAQKRGASTEGKKHDSLACETLLYGLLKNLYLPKPDGAESMPIAPSA
jgi:hypothetical protein